MAFMQLPPSERVNAYLEKMSVMNRNERRSKTSRSEISQEMKERILAITGPYKLMG